MSTRHSEGRALLRRCAGLVRRLDRTVGIPLPFDLDEFLARWTRERAGRPITLLPLTTAELPMDTCGLWLALADRDVVGFPVDATRNHRDHIVLHEVGHMLAAHSGGPAAPATGLSGLLPDLDPAMVRSVLGRSVRGRSVYCDVQEHEAELIASLILQRALWTAPRTLTGGQDGAVLERLERTLDR